MHENYELVRNEQMCLRRARDYGDSYRIRMA